MGIFDLLPASLKKAFGGLVDETGTGQSQSQAQPSQPPVLDQTVLSPRVLLVVYDPLVPSSGKPLSQHLRWNRVDELVKGYISDIRECSGGLVRYEVVERVDVDAFPIKADGFRYDAETFLRVVARQQPAHDPDGVDYHRILADYQVVERVQRNEIDELWLFAFPWAGFYESRMAGPGAFWCNAPALERTAHCGRRFVIMGFNYERGVGEMLENLGHRAESIMTEVFKHTRGEANLWTRYTRYDKVAPGAAEMGNVHFAPNSERDYDWGNRRYVLSRCDDWLNFPHLTGKARSVNCAEWGNGDIRGHHTWWFSHMPRMAGQTNGILNNWWRYIIDPNMVQQR